MCVRTRSDNICLKASCSHQPVGAIVLSGRLAWPCAAASLKLSERLACGGDDGRGGWRSFLEFDPRRLFERCLEPRDVVLLGRVRELRGDGLIERLIDDCERIKGGERA